MGRIFYLSAVAILAILASSHEVSAAGYSAFTLYSDVCLHQESGDLLGTRLGLLRMVDDTYAFYQLAEGWPGEPQIVKLDEDQLKKSRIDFQASQDGKRFSVQGRIAGNTIVLTAGGLRDHDEKILRLKKVALPERVPYCR